MNNLRFLTKAILYQKTELDKFFLETIDHIKRAMEISFSGSRMEPDGRKKKPKLPYKKYGALHWENQTYDFKSKKLPRKKSATLDPNLRSGSLSRDGGLGTGKKVDLSDLDWEEKEKIIRILYTKINMGVTPSYWRQIEMMVQNREDDEIEFEVDYEEKEEGDDFEYPIEDKDYDDETGHEEEIE